MDNVTLIVVDKLCKLQAGAPPPLRGAEERFRRRGEALGAEGWMTGMLSENRPRLEFGVTITYTKLASASRAVFWVTSRDAERHGVKRWGWTGLAVPNDILRDMTAALGDELCTAIVATMGIQETLGT